MDEKALLQRYNPRELGKPLATSQQLTRLRLNAAGTLLAAGGFQAQVLRWSFDSTALKELPALAGHNGWVSALAFHGERLFTADTWGRLTAWDADKVAWSLPTAHEGWIRQLVVSPDGSTLASCGRDGVVRLWSPAKGDKVRELTVGSDVQAVAFHPDGKSLVAGDLKAKLHVFEVASGKKERELTTEGLYLYERIQDVAGLRVLSFDAEGKRLLAAGCKPKSGGFVEGTPLLLVLDWVTGKTTATRELGTDKAGFVTDLAWHPDGFVLATTSGQPGSGQLLFLRVEDAKPFFVTPKMPNCHSLAVDAKRTRVIVAATNANSSGNGRVKGKGEKDYPGNFAPLQVWQLG